MNKRNLTGIVALAAAASLALVGCTTSSNDGPAAAGEDDNNTITLGFLPSWTDGLSTAYLLNDQLTKMGYDVEMEELTEAGVLYTGLAGGDIDIFPSAWPEVTHAEYMKKYGDKLEDLGAYYEGAVLTIAVPEYMDDVNSIEDLVGQADRFDGEIIGIEPGAGLTGVTQDSMMPAYGLDKEFTLVTSSTTAMLATLGAKIDKKEDIVVTLWRPFWANAAYPIKDLEDPKGAMGEPEALHFLGTLGFADAHADAAELIANIKLDDDAFGALESLMTSEEYKGKSADAVTAWIADHGDAFPGLLK